MYVFFSCQYRDADCPDLMGFTGDDPVGSGGCTRGDLAGDCATNVTREMTFRYTLKQFEYSRLNFR
jgi:hypothetical protein